MAGDRQRWPRLHPVHQPRQRPPAQPLGLSDWRLGPENSGGFVTIAAAGGLVYDTARLQPVAWTRGWAGAEAGQRLRVWNLVGNKNQRFKLVPAGTLQG